MLRNVGAVLAGYISIGILVVLTDKLLAGMNPGDWSPGQPIPARYCVVSIITAPLYSILGGYICAWIAKATFRQAILGLIVFGEMMGIISSVMMWSQQPHWYAILLLLFYPPCVYIGGLLRAKALRSAAA